jgi:peroxiredoxin family protein
MHGLMNVKLYFCTLSSNVYKYKTDYNIQKLDLFTHFYLRVETGYLGKHVLNFFKHWLMEKNES